MTTPDDPADGITVLRAHGRRLAKVVHADGTITGYDHAREFDLIELPVDGLDQVLEVLRFLEHRTDCCVVRGGIADPARTRYVRRLLYRDGEDEPTLIDVPRRWLALDIDTLERPDRISAADLPSCARIALRALPSEFHGARFLVQATAGAGIKPGIRLRLWCWLSRPVWGAELKRWLRAAPVDHAVFGAAQPIFTANPVFEAGAFDPVPSRLAVIPFSEQCGGFEDEAVRVPADLSQGGLLADGDIVSDRLLAKSDVPSSSQPSGPATGDNPYSEQRAARESRRAGGVGALIRVVEQAEGGNRNRALYCAARRAAEEGGDLIVADLLARAAIKAGLSADEAAATIASGWRR